MSSSRSWTRPCAALRQRTRSAPINPSWRMKFCRKRRTSSAPFGRWPLSDGWHSRAELICEETFYPAEAYLHAGCRETLRSRRGGYHELSALSEGNRRLLKLLLLLRYGPANGGRAHRGAQALHAFHDRYE